jgi:general secretion pathway protein D
MKLPAFATSLRQPWLACLLAAIFAAGCAQQRIRDEATTQLRAGDFESAMAGLREGVAQYPESATLRAGLTSTRSEALLRLMAQVAQLRGANRQDEAAKVLERALIIDPGNDRLLTLQADLALEKKLRSRMEEVNALLSVGKKEQALRALESALRDAPRQPDLVALQRQLESELRLEAGPASRRGLSETRPISLDFRNAPLGTVLEAITRGSGINFILDRDVRQDARVTIFLRSATIEDALEFVTGAHQLARRVVDAQTVLIYPNTPEKQREHQEQVIRMFRLSNADAKSTAALFRSVLRIKEPFIDERANLVAIRETPEIVALAERLVALQDVGEAEVMLEVEILEIKRSSLTELGINFPASFTLTPLPLPGSTGLTIDSLRSINSSRVGVGVGGLLFNLNRQVGDTNILANPRIRTKSREKARILIGDKVPVITSTSSSTGFVAETVNYIDVGLKLEVEPIVSPEDDVTIKLGLEVSSLAKEVPTKAGSLAYQIGTRNANTTLRLRDGETQLLAGLISNEERATSNRLPGLGDLPIAGRLFSSQKDDGQRTELVLAITPRILRGAPRTDPAQAEMWVGTELATRLRPAPDRSQAETPPKDGKAIGLSISPSTVQAAVGTALQASQAPRVPPGPVSATWQAPSEVKVGDVFTVSLNLASSSPLRGAPLELVYPKALMDVVDVIEGPYFKQNDGLTSFTQSVNGESGRIGVGILRNETSGAAGQGTLIQLRLKAKSTGMAEFRLTSFKPISVGTVPDVAEVPVLRVNVQ